MSSKVIDERILAMKFDNSQFESGVSRSMNTLDRLKAKLNMTGAAKGLEQVSQAARNVTTNGLSGLSSGIETVQAKFSALQVVGMTAISRITNTVINLGKRLVSAITVDPIKDGFREYETQMNAVQTILANTQKEGTNVKMVNAALDDLNHYADKTIYNFTEMTRNIGTFTAAGVKLNTSVSAIKGIANLAAVSGSSSMQASSAMYQLSQAIASGTVKLMDWNSVVNAGMGGQVFQDALIRTSKHLKTGAEAAIKAKGSFRESLQTGWLTTEVLTQTLDQFATAADTQEEYQAAVEKFVKQGYSKEEAVQMANMAKTAGDAATKVKTFTQLIDTIKEALGSGWTTTWRTIIGDFEDARNLWTDVSNVLNDAINKSSDARNKIVSEWANLGGRTKLIEGLSNVFKGLVSVITPIQKAFREIFPPTTSKQLLAMTEGFRKFTEKLVISDKTADKLKRTFKGLFSIADLVKKAFELVGGTIVKIFSSGAFGGVLDIILSFTVAIGDMFTALDKGIKISGLSSSIGKIISEIADVIKSAASQIDNFSNLLSKAGENISKTLGKIWDGITDVLGWITKNVSIGDILNGIFIGHGINAVYNFTDMIKTITSAIENIIPAVKERKGAIEKNVTGILDKVGDALENFTKGIDVSSVVAIAGALGILAASLKTIASLDAKDITKSVIAMGAMFVMLNRSFDFISQSLSIFKPKGVVKMGLSLTALATAVNILSNATKKLSDIDLLDLGKALGGLAVEMLVLTKGLNAINGVKIPLKTSVVMLALAESCKMLGDAMQKFAGLSWGEITRGLVGMGGALTEFVVSLKVLNKIGGFKSLAGSASLLIAVQSLKTMANGLKSFSGLSWGEITRGLVGMGGALGEVAVVTGLLGKLAGLKGLVGASTLVLGVQSLAKLQSSFADFSDMSWDEITHGLAGMGGALTELAVVSGLLGKLAGLKGLVGAETLSIAVGTLGSIADTLNNIGVLSWDEIARGLVGMGGALTELAVVSGLLGNLAGLGGLIGAETLVISVQSLGQLASALQQFGVLSWDEITRGLVGMGGALTELAVVSGLLGNLGGLFGLVGAKTLTIAVQSLGQLASALQQFASMSWDEIKNGLTAMAGALGEVALGSLINTLSGFGAGAIAKIAAPLGTLADSVKKWSGVTLPTNLKDMLGQLAGGVLKFTFGALGSGALSTVAAPLGTLADSMRKWTGLNLPDGIEGKLSSIANGVSKFSFLITAGWSLSTLVGPLGSLADAMRKWSGLDLPNDIEGKLSSIATGVAKFSFLFVAGWSLGSIVGPLGALGDAMRKWSGLDLPNDIEKKLGSIANGVSKFSFLITAGWSLGAIVGPLGSLATGVRKLQGLDIPEDIEKQLGSVANSIKKFSNVGDVSMGVLGVKTVASAVSKLSGVSYSNVSSGLSGLAKSFSGFASSAKSLNGVGNTIVNNLVNPVKNAAKQLNSVGKSITNSISNGIKSGKGSITSAMNGIVSSLTTTLSNKNSTFKMIGSKFSSQLSSGIKSGKSGVSSASNSLVSGASKKLRSHYDSFNSAGKYLAKGFANGIKSNSYLSATAARTMGNNAAKILRKALNVHSPSRVTYKIGRFFDIGFANAISDNSFRSANAAYSMGDDARKVLTKAISKMSNIMDSDINTQPVITPVLDLSNISSGAASINGLFGDTQTVGVRANLNAINTAMRANQNNQNEDVVNAIDKLRKDLNNVNTGDTYSINGVYANDDDIIEAIKSIVRAVKIERRV